MQLFPPLLYWSCGSGQCSKVSAVLKPSRKLIRERGWPEVGVKAWLLLGRASGRLSAVSIPTWASGGPHRTESYSLAPGHWWQHHVERQFSVSLIIILLRHITKSSSQTNQETNRWQASRGFSAHCWPEPSHAGIERFALAEGMCFTLSAILSRTSPLLLKKTPPKAPTHQIVLFCLGLRGTFFHANKLEVIPQMWWDFIQL